jgi:hypothetical protein
MEISGPASWTNGTLSFTGAGTVTVTASLSGDNNYLPAAYTTTFQIAKSSQTIKPFVKIADRKLADGNVQIVPPVSSSGNTVVLTVKSGPAVIDADNFINFTGIGTIVIAANQGGDSNYLPAKEVILTFKVK